jgi:hypothetical protein
MIVSKNKLVLTELHYTSIHGKTEGSYPFIESHYLLIGIFDPISMLLHSPNEEDSEDNNNDNENMHHMLHMIHFYKNMYKRLIKRTFVSKNPHPIIRNFEYIINRNDYIKPEIGECIIFPTQEQIVIIKTFWIRLIQRTWKRIFKAREQMIRNPTFLYRWQLGKASLNDLPNIVGMLSYLQKELR